MTSSAPSACMPPPRSLRQQLFRDVTSLLITSHLVSRALRSVRPECAFSADLTAPLDQMLAVSDAGESYLYQPLLGAGATLPVSTDATACALVTGFFTRLPTGAAPRELAKAIAINLRFVAQHFEIKAGLAAENALMLGQEYLGYALVAWAEDWLNAGRSLRDGTQRHRAQAEIAHFADYLVPQVA